MPEAQTKSVPGVGVVSYDPTTHYQPLIDIWPSLTSTTTDARLAELNAMTVTTGEGEDAVTVAWWISALLTSPVSQSDLDAVKAINGVELI